MFKSLGLLSDVPCPEHPQCHLAYCIFSHEFRPSVQPFPNVTQQTQLVSVHCDAARARSRKRRRLENGSESAASISQGPPYIMPARQLSSPARPNRLISPPPSRRATSAAQMVSKATLDSTTSSRPKPSPTAISLNPRMLANAPAPHAKRMQIITMMFENLDRLNQTLLKSADSSDRAVVLSRDALILQALDEEETAATKNPSIYENVVKMRIMRLKKMSISEWKSERTKHVVASKQPQALAKSSSPVDTGLSPSQEITFLPRLLAQQVGLERHGYVTAKPLVKDVDLARSGLEAAREWEECDRCRSRFQVFNGRRGEDGVLTSGGTCFYHPAKARRPLVVDKADKASKELIYACCKQNLGVSPGCTIATTHVFKVTSPARLELLVPFERTPDNAILGSQLNAVCFDCEMGYTACGLEMIRLTATDFPTGTTILDTLVRPKGEILDLNSRYSGVWPEDFAKAVPYKAGMLLQPENTGLVMPIVDSLATARELLFSFLSQSTILIGHALENDLNVARIIHPAIIDTVLLFPHPRGLPIRYGLKMLVKKYLNRDIQLGDGSQGHNSKEDAVAAGELVRYKIQEAWAKMSREGWTIVGTEFIPPESRDDAMRDDTRKLE